MKQLIRLLSALAVFLPLVSCEEAGEGPSKDDLVGTWRSERVLIDGERQDVTMYITIDKDGSGYLDDPDDRFRYELDGSKLTVRPPRGDEEYVFTVEMKNSDEMILMGNVVPGSDAKVSFEGYFKRVSGGSGDNNGNNGNNGGNDSGDGSYSDDLISFSAVGEPVWEREGNVYFAVYYWSFRIKDEQLSLNIYSEEGRDYTYGIGYYPVGKEDTPPRYFNGNDQGRDSHEQAGISDDGREIFVRSRIKADNDKTARCYVYLSKKGADGSLSGGDFFYGSTFTVVFDPDAANDVSQDIGVAMPEQESHTATSITLRSSFTGTYTSSEPFREAACGFLLCPASQGAPQWGEASTIDCTQSAWDNNGEKFVGTFDNLEPGQQYNVCAWLVMKPGSDPILSDWRSVGTQKGNDNPDNEVNWVKIENVASSQDGSSLNVSVSAYFDSGTPVGIGVCYNTTGSPTVADALYNAFEHIDFEKGEYDDTIISMIDNKDGSKTVTAVISGLRPGTTYYLRSYMQWASDEIHPIIYDEAVSVTTLVPDAPDSK